MNPQEEFDFEPRKASSEPPPEGIVDKVKKLLRLAASKCNRHEAELALRRAFELARKHNIDVESLDLDERTARITHEWFAFSKRATFLEVRACQIAQSFFRVDAILSRGRLLFVGTASDIAIAHYAFEFIVRVGKAERRAFEVSERKARRKMSTGKRQSFVQGFIYGIAAQLKKADAEFVLTDAQKTLVVADQKARENYADQLVPDTKPVLRDIDRKHESAIHRGFVAGITSTLNTPLDASPAAAVLALK